MSLALTQVMLAKGFGGAERHFVDLCLELAQRGHRVQAICHRRFVNRHLLQAHPDIQVVTVAVRGAWDVLAQRRVRAAIRAYKPDVIHAHLARAAHFAGRAGARLGIPVVVKTHNYVDLKYYRHVDRFITTTEDQRRYLGDHGIAAERVTVIPNFSRMAARERGPTASERPPVFVSYGRFVHKKGFDVLLEAFARYAAAGGRGSLVIGGSGPEQAKLEALCQGLGLGERARFAGWVDDVAAFLDRGDVFVLPSRDEPFGIAVLEAMARGLPMICTRTQGPREILDPSTARLVAIGDAVELTEALLEHDRDPAGSRDRARRAGARYVERYSAAAVIPRIVATYEAAIALPPARGA